MPPTFTTECYQHLLQKIAALETELHHLKVELGHGKGNKTADWNSLGARPKDSNGQKNAGIISSVRKNREAGAQRLTGRTVSLDNGSWPPLQKQSSSTPLNQRKTAKPPLTGSIQLHNRFSPLQQKEQSESHDIETVSPPRVRKMANPESKLQAKGEQFTELLIVGDIAVKNLKTNNATVLCFPKDTVNDMKDRLETILKDHPKVKTLILHVGAADVDNRQSETLKLDFKALFAKLHSLDKEPCVWISGPLPPMRSNERFSRFRQLSKWLASACQEESFNFIDNFNFFYDRQHYFTKQGNLLNRAGVNIFASNILYSLNHSKATAASGLAKTADRVKCSIQPPRPATAEVHACVCACIQVSSETIAPVARPRACIQVSSETIAPVARPRARPRARARTRLVGVKSVSVREVISAKLAAPGSTENKSYPCKVNGVAGTETHSDGGPCTSEAISPEEVILRRCMRAISAEPAAPGSTGNTDGGPCTTEAISPEEVILRRCMRAISAEPAAPGSTENKSHPCEVNGEAGTEKHPDEEPCITEATVTSPSQGMDLLNPSASLNGKRGKHTDRVASRSSYNDSQVEGFQTPGATAPPGGVRNENLLPPHGPISTSFFVSMTPTWKQSRGGRPATPSPEEDVLESTMISNKEFPSPSPVNLLRFSPNMLDMIKAGVKMTPNMTPNTKRPAPPPRRHRRTPPPLDNTFNV